MDYFNKNGKNDFYLDMATQEERVASFLDDLLLKHSDALELKGLKPVCCSDGRVRILYYKDGKPCFAQKGPIITYLANFLKKEKGDPTLYHLLGLPE